MNTLKFPGKNSKNETYDVLQIYQLNCSTSSFPVDTEVLSGPVGGIQGQVYTGNITFCLIGRWKISSTNLVLDRNVANLIRSRDNADLEDK